MFLCHSELRTRLNVVYDGILKRIIRLDLRFFVKSWPHGCLFDVSSTQHLFNSLNRVHNKFCMMNVKYHKRLKTFCRYKQFRWLIFFGININVAARSFMWYHLLRHIYQSSQLTICTKRQINLTQMLSFNFLYYRQMKPSPKYLECWEWY